MEYKIANDKQHKIIQAVNNFVKGGDERNTELLNKVLHPHFRLANDTAAESPADSIVDKTKYLSLIKEKVYGGLPREIIIDQIDEINRIAMVKLFLKSSALTFTSFLSLVADENDEWKILNNLSFIEADK